METNGYLRNRQPDERKAALNVSSEDRTAFRLMMTSNQGFGMETAKNWLSQRFGPTDLIDKQYSAPKRKNGAATIITPANVPEFVIPRATFLVAELETQKIPQFIMPSGDKQTMEDDSQSPLLTSGSYGQFQSMESMGTCDTNSDPGSLAAVSMSHLKTKTSFGFTTLSEQPHTRRKESLFMTNISHVQLKRLARKQDSRSSLFSVQSLNPLHEGEEYAPLPSRASDSNLMSNGSASCEDASWGSFRLMKQPPTSPIITRNKPNTITLSMNLDMENNKLKITVMRIKVLTEKSSGEMFVRSCLINGKTKEFRHQTNMKRSSPSSHQYSDSLFYNDFTVSHADDSYIDTRMLRLKVYNKPSYSRARLVGQAMIQLSSIELQPSQTIMLSDVPLLQRQKKESAQIYTSMRFDEIHNSLEITLHRIRHLKFKHKKYSGCFLKVKFRQQHAELLQQTTICKSTSNPEFKETMDFTVYQEQTNPNSEIPIMLLELYSRDFYNSDTLIGSVILRSHIPNTTGPFNSEPNLHTLLHNVLKDKNVTHSDWLIFELVSP